MNKSIRIDIDAEMYHKAAELGRKFGLTAEQVLETAFLEYAEGMRPAEEQTADTDESAPNA